MKYLPGIIFLTLAILLSAGPTYSQIAPRGLKVGLSYTTLNSSRFESGRKLGLSAGVVFFHEVSESFVIQPEALVVMKGCDFYGWYSNPERADATISSTHFEMPILAAYRYTSKKGIITRMYAGPAFSFRLTAKVTYHDSGNTVDLDRVSRSFDLGIAVGVEVGFKIGKNLFSLDTRYTPGLANQNSVTDLDIKSNVITLMLGVLFL